MQTKILSFQEIMEAVSLLKKGEVVAFPTETVYGLGASIFNPVAISQIFSIKGRPSDNPLIAHISDLSQAAVIATELSDDFYLLADAFWPGPLTIVVTKSSLVPEIATAGLNSIGIRMPGHPMARELIGLANIPLVAPSANVSGRPSPTSAEHVLQDFSGQIPAVLDGGRCEIGIESTVISLVHGTPTLLRPGMITKEEMEKVLGKPVFEESIEVEKPKAPGMKYRHYAPKAKITLFDSQEEMKDRLCHTEGKVLVLGSSTCGFQHLDNFHACSSFDLYFALRYADEKAFSEVFIYCDQKLKLDKALMNRISKAASS